MMEETNLVEIVKQIEQKEILLPDFQRGFVWKDEEMQKKLLASVLAKMPLGSILLLKDEANSYGCKKIGSKNREDTESLGNTEIKLLLDGQQRVTVLTNIFSDVIFASMDYKCGNNLISPTLKKRFYIRIPKYKNDEEMQDLFGVNKLEFPIKNAKTDLPNFLTETILKYIYVENFFVSQEKMLPSYPKETYEKKLTDHCKKDDCYLIPMFLLIETSTTSKKNRRFNTIMGKIVEDIVDDMKEEYTKINDINEEDANDFVKKLFDDEEDEDYQEWKMATDNKEIYFEKMMLKKGKDEWQEKIKDYLESCINNMNLHQIVIEKSNRERAIDIYENLNLGGVTLSTFDLILAKAARSNEDKDKNLFEKIVEYIETKQLYPTELIPESVEPYFVVNYKDKKYSASKELNCYISSKNMLNGKYTDSFLNILSLMCNNPDYKPDKVSVDYIKRKRILELTSQQINSSYKNVCKGLERACMFLNMRCGIRDIKEVNYTLILVLIGYIFTNDKYFENKDIHRKLEALYWSAIFSGEYDKDQNVTVIKHIKEFLRSIENSNYEWIAKMKDDIFERKDFSDKNILIPIEEDVFAKDVIRTTICQYFLAQTYKDMLDSNKIVSVFMADEIKLEEHHILARGELSVKMSKINNDRNNKNSLINSPLNFVYITSETNKKISNTTLGEYIKECKDETIVSLGISDCKDSIGEDRIHTFLEKRYTYVKGHVKTKIEKLLA